jgi:ribosome biogenesis GTPase
MIDLKNLGWDDHFESAFNQYKEHDTIIAGRISFISGPLYTLVTTQGIIRASLPGTFTEPHCNLLYKPVAGDFAAVDISESTAVIREILPRINEIARTGAGTKGVRQVLGANIDIIFLVTSLNRDFNIRRIERYLTLIWNTGAVPVIVLNKSDLCSDPSSYLEQLMENAPGIDFEIISARESEDLSCITGYLEEGKTGILLGSSGVGKSTICNRLMSMDILATREVREKDQRGKHATTSRELFLLPGGGVLIDTPGLREIRLLDSREGLENTFSDIEELALVCKFSDCSHENEPGCAVQKAIQNGTLDQNRFDNYKKMEKEIDHYKRRQGKPDAKKRWKHISKLAKQLKKESPKHK